MPILQLPLRFPILLLLAGSFVGLAASYDISRSLSVALGIWAGILLYVVIVAWGSTAARVRLLAQIVALAGSAGALLLFLQYRHLGFAGKLGLATALGNFTSAPFPQLLTMPLQQNLVANLFVGALPLALGLWWSGQQRTRHLWLGCTLLLGAAVGLTVSRGALLALAACAGLAGLLWLAMRWPRLVLGGVAITILLALGALVLLIFSPLQQSSLVQAFIERALDRGILYRNTLFLALDLPLTGIGLGDTFGMIYSRYVLLIQSPFLTYTHNLPLAVWLGQGILGLLGLGALLLGLSRLMILAGRNAAGPLWLGAALGSLALLLHGLSDAPQYNPGSGWLAMLMSWAVLGVTVASARMASPLPTAPQRQAQLTAPIRRLALPGVLFVLLLFSARPLLGMAVANLAMLRDIKASLAPGLSQSERIAERDAAAEWFTAALRITPDQPTALRQLGIHAMDRQRFASAIPHLEAALRSQLAHQANWKALGLAYLWNGRVEAAVNLFQRLDRAQEVQNELNTWSWWWGEQNRPELAAYAAQAAQRMAEQRSAQGKP